MLLDSFSRVKSNESTLNLIYIENSTKPNIRCSKSINRVSLPEVEALRQEFPTFSERGLLKWNI